jgi:four helix bundle protein
MAHESYEKLIVWQKSMDAVEMIYDITANFPRTEMYGLSSKMRRAAVSIPSNIAEGSRRKSQKETQQFLRIAFGSASELETQLKIALRLKFVNAEEYTDTSSLLEEILRMLNKMTSA